MLQIMTDAALLKRQKKEIEDLRAKLTVDLVFCFFFCLIENKHNFVFLNIDKIISDLFFRVFVQSIWKRRS